MSDDVAFKAAELLREDAAVLIAELRAEQAKSVGLKQVWQRVANLARAASESATAGNVFGAALALGIVFGWR